MVSLGIAARAGASPVAVWRHGEGVRRQRHEAPLRGVGAGAGAPSAVQPARGCLLPAARKAGRRRALPVRALASAGSAALDLGPLTDWLASKGVVGADSPVQASVVDGRPCLVASRPVKAGETLVEVPEKAWISPAVVAKSRIGGLVQGLEPWVQLVLFLVQESCAEAAGEGSWPPYTASLPAELPDSTLFWDDEQLAMLAGTQCLANTLGYREFLEAKFAELEAGLFASDRGAFPADVYTRSAFFHAFAWLRARVHAPLERDNIALVPLADLVQHSSGAKAAWSLRDNKVFGLGGGQTLVLESDRAYEAGEQIVMNFGAEAVASQLALDYGVADNKLAGFSLTLSIPEDDPFFDDKADIAELAGYAESWTWTLRATAPVPDDLMGYLRLINCSGEDAFHLEALFRDAAWQHLMAPISPENEGAICKSIVDGCMGALQAYGSTIDADLAMLRAGDLEGRELTAVQVRLGEKQTLDSYQRFFAGRLDDLDELEFYAESRLKSLGLLDDNGERPTFEGMLDSGIA